MRNQYRDRSTGEWFETDNCADCVKDLHEGFDWNPDEYGEVRCDVCHKAREAVFVKEMEDEQAWLDEMNGFEDALKVADIRLTLKRA